MDNYHIRQNAFKHIGTAHHVLTSIKNAEESKKTILDILINKPATKYENARTQFIKKLNRVISACPDYIYIEDFSTPKDISPIHCVVKAREALISLSMTENNPVVIEFISDALKEANTLLEFPAPETKTNNEEMSK